ncbi:protein TRI1-like [Miscanthus floridulus]|uniref:protein TRI1-like n=1 Tax=Miscanthus floridulus TaxID=154761 RepID=UPI0034581C54
MAAVARVFRGSLFLMSPAAGAAAGAKKAGAASAAVATKKRTKAASTEPRALTGIRKPMPVSDEFSRFAGGAPEVARSDAMKLIWAHIKAHGLQDPAKKTEINCDATLKSLFGGRDRIGMLEIMKLLRPHFLKN